MEMFFYIYCSLLFIFKILSKRWVVILSFAAFVVLALATGVMRSVPGKGLPVAIHLLMAMMFFGYMIRLRETNVITRKDIIGCLLFFFIAPPLTANLAYSGKDLHHVTAMYFSSYLIGCAVFLACYRYKIGNAITTQLGKISYSTYLIHQIIIYILLEHGIDKNVNRLVFIYLITAYIFSVIFFGPIEKPLVDIGVKLRNRVSPPAARIEGS